MAIFFVFVLGNGYLAVPANPENACGTEFYLGLVNAHHVLVFETFLSAMLLLAVRMAVTSAEAGARAAASARGRADHEAAVMGLASVPDGWKRRSVRLLLRLAVFHYAIASCFAICTFEDGYRYRFGCPGGDRKGVPFYVLALIVVAVQGFSNWVASE